MMVAHGGSFICDATEGSLSIQPDGDIFVQTGTAWMKLEASSPELKKSASCESCGAPLRPECMDCAYCNRPNPSAKAPPVARSRQPDLTTPLVQEGGRFIVEGMIDAQMEQNRALMGKCDEIFAKQIYLLNAQMAQGSKLIENADDETVNFFMSPEEKKSAPPDPKAKSVVRDQKTVALVKEFKIAMQNESKWREIDLAFSELERQEARDQALLYSAVIGVVVLLLPVLIAISIAAG